VVHPVEEGFQVEIDHPGVTAGDGVLSPADRLVGGATGPKAVALVGKVGVEDRGQHLKEGLLDKTVEDRRHPEGPHLPAGLGDIDPADRLRPVGACVETSADLWPVGMAPGTQVLGPHTVRAGGSGVRLDALERPGEIPAGEKALPQVRRGGVRVETCRRWEGAPLFAGGIRLHRLPIRKGPIFGVGCHHGLFHKNDKGPSDSCVRPFPADPRPRRYYGLC